MRMRSFVVFLALVGCVAEPTEYECAPAQGLYAMTGIANDVGTCGDIPRTVVRFPEVADGEAPVDPDDGCEILYGERDLTTCGVGLDMICPLTNDFGDIIGSSRWTGYIEPTDRDNEVLEGDATIIVDAGAASCSGTYHMRYERL